MSEGGKVVQRKLVQRCHQVFHPGRSSLSTAVSQGKLVPDNIILDLLSKQLELGVTLGERGFILDGFPQTRLQAEDIGLSMGTQGMKVAKESSDIIILEDNFASIVKVVRWGRSVYATIQKFIQFQLTVNVAAIAINFVAAVSSRDVPLSEVQLLWVDLIMDTLGAFTLETKSPTDHLMQRPPIERR